MLYHLYSFTREGTSFSLSPMGLSGLGYNGHVFWDADLWMFPPLLVLHPEMAGLYRQKVTALAEALEHPETRTEASEALRGLIDAIVMTPAEGTLRIELKGNLAAMLGATVQSKRSPETGDLSLQVSMVAGAGFEPATFGL